MTAPLIEILAIGNELLAGDVLDTNSHWLCRQLAGRGARVSRMATLPDDVATIGEALLAALSRRPALIVTCGGLGPTADDLTVAAQAAALGRALAENPAAFAMVRDFYATLFRRGEVTTPDMTPARAKMAVLPADAEPLPNSVGAAPGVLMIEGETLIAALPGVPAEMKAIFEESLWPRVAARFGGQAYAERVIQTNCWDESIMAPAVDAVAARHPRVYVKSRAQVYGGGLADFVTLAARADTPSEAQALLDGTEADLRTALRTVNVEILSAEGRS
jgi:molybdenum cofactor synthesis domain-containing protein